MNAFLGALTVPAVLAMENHTILSANEAFTALSGFTHSELEGRMAWPGFLANEMGSSLPWDICVLPDDLECQLIDRNGDRKSVIVSAAMLSHTTARIITFFDVTRFRRADEPYRRQRRLSRDAKADPTPSERAEKFETLFERSSDAAVLFDGDVIIDANPAALAMMGCTHKSQLLGRRASDLSPEKQPDGTLSSRKEKELAARSISEGSLRFEWVYRRSDGKKVPAEGVFTPIPVGERQIFHCVVRDITERQKTQERLRLTQFAVDQAKDSVVWYGKDGRFIYVNDAACRASGYSREELLSMAVPDVDPNFTAMNWDRYWRNRRHRGAMVFESIHRSKDGRVFPVEISSYYLKFNGTEYMCALTRDITERKRMEDALRESENKFRSLAEKALVGIYLIQDGIFTYVNPTFAQIHGHRADMIVDRMGYRDMVHREDLPEIEKCIETTVMGPRTTMSAEFRIVRGDKRVVTVEVRGSRTLYRGRPALIGTLLDITERKQTEEALRESEKRYRELAGFLPQTVFETDGDAVFTFLNRQGSKDYQYTKKDLHKGISIMDLIGEGDRERAEKNLKRIMAGARPAEHEYTIRRKDGTPCPVMLYTSRIMRGNRCTGLRGIVIDITERKRADKALKESEEKFHQLFEQNEQAVIIFQPGAGRILDVNPAAVELYGFTRAALIKQGPSLFFGQDDLIRFENLLSRVRTAGSFGLESVWAKTNHGRKIRVQVRGNPIQLSDTHLVYCTFRDITEQARLEEDAALAHSKLIHANKMTSLGVLVSSVAHEVNNPNNFIMFNASLLSDAWRDALKVLAEYHDENGDFSLGGLPFGEMRDVVVKLLEGITDGSRRIKRIVDNLKDFARQDNAVLDNPADMNKVVSDSVSLLTSPIKQLTRTFSMELSPGLPPVKGSFQQLEQVMINLIMNALQALPDRDRGVKIATSLSPDGSHVAVVVEDEGIGMSEETMEKIMEPFFTTKLDMGGTGLGLSISHSIIKDHKGSIKFESTVGRGTHATVKLPLF
jgi:PAS domain S-box-containing protein